MVSAPKGLSENIPMDVGASGNLNNPCKINPLSQFSELLGVKKKLMSIDWDMLKNCKAIITVNVL